MEAMGIVTEGQGDPSAMVKEMTGVELPSYYNANAINPMKYAEGVRIYLQNLAKIHAILSMRHTAKFRLCLSLIKSALLCSVHGPKCKKKI